MGTVDGLAGVSSRIAEIEGRISALRATQPGPPVGAVGAVTSTPFASVLADAVAKNAAPGTSGTTGAAVKTATASRTAPAGGGLNADGVPHELAAYGNGHIPSSALSPIGHGSHRMWAPAAESFARLAQAAARDGVTIKVTDSYRSFEAQVDVARRKGLYSQGGLAAKPGTSDHGWGRSLDLNLDARALSWMRENAARYGFVEDVPREPWHWTFTPPQ